MRRAAVVIPSLLAVLLVPVVAAIVGAWAQGWTLASVSTGSMRPGTPPGSMVVLAPTSPADVEVGDVIGYRDDRRAAVVTHRVVAILEQPSGRYFTTQGDANARPDGRPVPARDVVGEVRWRIAGLGAVVDAAGDRRVQVALAAVPLGLLLLSELAGWRGRRLGRVIAALRAEIEWLRASAAGAGAVEPAAPRPVGPPVGPGPPGAPRVPVAPEPAAEAPPRRSTDGTACVAGLAAT